MSLGSELTPLRLGRMRASSAETREAFRSLWLRLGLRNHRQLCGIPGGEASCHLDQMRDPMLMQDADGDRRAVAARAMDGDAAVAGDFGDALLQMVERDIHAALNSLRVLPLNELAFGLLSLTPAHRARRYGIGWRGRTKTQRLHAAAVSEPRDSGCFFPLAAPHDRKLAGDGWC